MNEKSRRPLRDPDHESNEQKITNTNSQIDNNVCSVKIKPGTKFQKISLKENHPKQTGKHKQKKISNSDDIKLGVIELDHKISDSESNDEQSRNVKMHNIIYEPNDLSSRNFKPSTNETIILEPKNTSKNDENVVELKNNTSNVLTRERHESKHTDNNLAEIVVEMNKAAVSSFEIEILDEKKFQGAKEKAVTNSIHPSRNEMQNVINNAVSNQNCKGSEDIFIQKPELNLEIKDSKKLQLNKSTGMEMEISDELQIDESSDDERNDSPENSASHFCDPKNESICLSKKFRIVENKGMD